MKKKNLLSVLLISFILLCLILFFTFIPTPEILTPAFDYSIEI